jgi:hypothetical protein
MSGNIRAPVDYIQMNRISRGKIILHSEQFCCNNREYLRGEMMRFAFACQFAVWRAIGNIPVARRATERRGLARLVSHKRRSKNLTGTSAS